MLEKSLVQSSLCILW